MSDLWRYIPLVPLALVVLVAVLLFVEALLTRHSLLPVSRADAPDASGQRPAVQAALNNEFEDLGVWAGGDGVFKDRHTLLLSPDGRTLLVAHHSKDDSRWLISRLDDARWIVTGSNWSAPDVSGMSHSQTHLRMPLWQLMAAHAQHIDGLAGILPFTRDFIDREIAEHFGGCFLALKDAGMASRSADGSNWRHTVRGALRVTVASVKSLGAVFRQGQTEALAGSPSPAHHVLENSVDAVMADRPPDLLHPTEGQRVAPSAAKAFWLGAMSAGCLAGSLVLAPNRVRGGGSSGGVPLGLLLAALAAVLGLSALLLGLRTRRQIRRDPSLTGRTSAIVGIAAGGFMAICLALILLTFGSVLLRKL